MVIAFSALMRAHEIGKDSWTAMVTALWLDLMVTWKEMARVLEIHLARKLESLTAWVMELETRLVQTWLVHSSREH